MPKPLFDPALLARAESSLARRGAFNFVSKLRVARAPARPADAWFKIVPPQNKDTAAEIFIFDEIGYWGITAADFAKSLKDIDAKTINVRINSPGGSVFDGFAIYNALVQKDAEIVVIVDGWAASIASVIMCAGDVIKIGEAAQVMIHEPWGIVIGSAADMRMEADVLDGLESAIVDIYEARTGADRDDLTAWVKAETWFKGSAAVEAGFADEVIPLKTKKKDEEQDSAAPASRLPTEFFDQVFKNLPDELRAALIEAECAPSDLITTEREFEAFLKQTGGFSGQRAKAIANQGFKSNTRQAGGKATREPPGGAKAPVEPVTERPEDAVKRAATVAALMTAAATFPRIPR